MIDVKLPAKVMQAVDNLTSCQYNNVVLYGGRGGGKSDSVATLIILESYIDDGVILCGREYQVTIKDSLYNAIVAEIENKGLMGNFTCNNREIINETTGARIIFAGFKANITNIKSVKKLRVVVAEEAENISQASWDIILPTPRYNSEHIRIYVVFNPRFETDPTYQQFVAKPDAKTLLINIGWQDNPWLPDYLNDLRLRAMQGDAGRYAWVWEGKFLELSDASILGHKLEVCEFDYSEFTSPLIGVDWGFSVDPTCVVECYEVGNTLYITRANSQVGLELSDTAQWLIDAVPNIESHASRADSARPETISMIRNRLQKMTACKKWAGSVVDGISVLLAFDKIKIHTSAQHVYAELIQYKYKTDKYDKVTTDIVDSSNHYADALRYAIEPLVKQKPKVFI